MKEELTAADMVISEGLVNESHPHEEIGTSNFNVNSEKSDYDSVGLEMVKSMMTFLLPQAIPLLKKASKKKKATIKSQGKNKEARYFVDVPPPGTVGPFADYFISSIRHSSFAISIPSSFVVLWYPFFLIVGSFLSFKLAAVTLTENACLEKDERMHIQSTVIGSGPSFEHTTSVVPDSFEDDQCEDLVTKQVILSSDIAEADQGAFDKDTSPFNTWGQLIVQNESSVSHVETSGSKDILCYNEVHLTLNEKPQRGDGCVSTPFLACTSPSTKILPENINACAHLDENLVGVEIHSKGKHLNTVPNCTEGNAIMPIFFQ